MPRLLKDDGGNWHSYIPAWLPAKLKTFYMKKTPKKASDEGVVFTESWDLLMPNVGEIVGEHLIQEDWHIYCCSPGSSGRSMRIADMDELLAAYKSEGIDPEPHYWFKYALVNVVNMEGLGVEARECQMGFCSILDMEFLSV